MPQSRCPIVDRPAACFEALESRRLMDGAVLLRGEASVSDQGLWDAMFASQIAESRAADTADASESVECDGSGEHGEVLTDDDIYGAFGLWSNTRGQSDSTSSGVVGEFADLPAVDISEIEDVVVEPAAPDEPTDDDIYGSMDAMTMFIPCVPSADAVEASSGVAVWRIEWASSAIASKSGTEAVEIVASFADLSGLPPL